MTQFTLSEHITLNIGCSMNLDTPQKFKMIYFDPPFNSDREYKLNCNSDVGFSDKWEDCDYETFIRKNIEKLYHMLEEDGTLFFHISSACMFIPEKVLRETFKMVEPIFWKKCRSKNNVKTKLGSVMDIIFKCNIFTLYLLVKNTRYFRIEAYRISIPLTYFLL